MAENADYLEIIKRAQFGSREDMSRLAEVAKGKVFIYIYRVTLDYHLAQDLSQETVLEMIQSLKRLKIENAKSFWGWLYRTALGKVQHNFRNQGNKRIERKTVFSNWELLKNSPKDNKSGLEKLLHKELSQIILSAMSQMKVSYRNILTLRFFDEMSYSDIAAITGISEMRAMVQFFRAKQSLKKQLAKNGFKKEHLLPAIGVFGAITSFSAKSASAAVSISPAATKAGTTFSVIGAMFSQTGIIAAAAVAITMASTFSIIKTFGIKFHRPPKSIASLVRTKAFENPSSLIRSYSPNGDVWMGWNRQNPEQPAIKVSPERLLIGRRSLDSANLVVIFPEGWWLELGFSDEIVDGRGVDIILDGRDTSGPPLVFITDGAGQELQLTSTPLYKKTDAGWQYIAFDISGLSLPFKPRAVRIVGADNKGPWGGAEIWAVWARVSR